MVWEKYGVRLEPEQRDRLEHVVRAGKSSARVTTRARILLKTDDGWFAPQVAEALDVALGTVYRIKRRFAEAGLEGVLQDRPQAQRCRKLDDRGEAHLIALACSPAPEGHDHWTLRLLAGRLVGVVARPVPLGQRIRVRSGGLPDAEHLGPADRTDTLSCGPAILKSHLLRVLNLLLTPTLEAISLHRLHPQRIGHGWSTMIRRDIGR